MLKRAKSLRTVPRRFFRYTIRNSKSFKANEITTKTRMPYVIKEDDYKYKEGQVYHGFQCVHVEHNSDFDLISCTLKHIKTGTELWYLDRNDTNNVFSINFRTPAFDSMGAPHILEHLALCGSQQFPVRDPFFKMLNRSVATNMNALTGPDFTVYPCASRNEVDFRNIQRIYLDAVFKPKLLYLDFLQEGWRLEHKNIHDPKSEIMFKGIVFNEMKGIYSENSRLFIRSIFHNLLPNTNYKFTSGGNPMQIPNLSHSDLIEYHRKYYHPSNARIFCYGSFDLMATLQLIDKDYLSYHEFKDSSFSLVPMHPRWTEPRGLHISGRLSNMGAPKEKQHQVGIGLVMNDRTDIQQNFEMNLLCELLIRGPNSPFYRSLIEPNFSGGFNKNTGYFYKSRDTYFVVGLQDVAVKDFEVFKQIFDQTISNTINEGFENDHVESVLHSIELSLKHQRPDFGNELLFSSMTLWNHDGDVVANLRVSEIILKLRTKLKEDKNYLQALMHKYFANNPHKLILTMSPDEFYEEKLKQAESELLVQKVNYLSPEQLEQVYKNGIELDAAQKAKENTQVLPCLALIDVEEPIRWPVIKEIHVKGVPTQVCKVPTNSITYLNCMFNICDLSRQEIMLIPLFCNVITNVGTNYQNFRDFNKHVLSKTAGFTFRPKLIENVKDSKSYRLGLMMSTHALDHNVVQMFKLCKDLLLNFKINDMAHLKMLVKNYISNISVGIAATGHNYAILSSAAFVSDAAKLKSLLTGVEHIEFMKVFVEEHRTYKIRDILKDIGTKIFNKSNMRAAINCSASFQPRAIEYYKRFVDELPSCNKMNKNIKLSLQKPGFQHYPLNTSMNYCAKSFFAVPYLHRDHPVLRVLAKLISAKYLLPVVREQNGAYGAGAKIGYDGIFHFYSYRDPNTKNTLDVFDKTYEWLQAESDKLDYQSLFEAKLGVLQLLDWPTAPGEIGIDYFVLGVSQEMYEIYRSHVLSVTMDELRNVIEKYFNKTPKHFGSCIIGPKSEKLKKETNQTCVQSVEKS